MDTIAQWGIEESTGIPFPDGISQVDVFDNLETAVTAHVKLLPHEIESFVKTYGFIESSG